MRTIVITALLALVVLTVGAQTKVAGSIIDVSGEPIPFVTVYLDETFEGSSTDEAGRFEFDATSTGTFTLVASAVGFQTVKKQVTVASAILDVQITLLSADQVLGPVVVSAGAFDASSEAKSAMLEPLDIVMNAGAQGDLYKAIETLPGVSQVGNETGLFVRGGDAHETKTIIDGTIVAKPFFSDLPNIASRSRFDPFMFKGTTFTTGGYSAEYGRALSSVLLLETEDIPRSTSSSLGVNMAGINVAHQQVWDETTALMGNVSYNNLSLLFNSVPQNVDWIKAPEGIGTNWAFRQKTKNGIFKSLLQHQRGETGMHTTNFENREQPHVFRNKSSTTYWNTNYKGTLNSKWGIYAGLAMNLNKDKIKFDSLKIKEETRMLHAKTTLYYEAASNISLRFGAESFLEEERERVHTFIDQGIQDHYTAVYTESDIALGDRWAFRVGGRAEYSDLISKVNIAPRTSMAYKTGKNSQVSLAYGHFYQKPEGSFLYIDKNMDFEQSTHLIANYQWTTKLRSFRVELYDKRYNHLVKNTSVGRLSNQGDGYSRGIDLFWKDEKTIRNLDYWVSYSYIDAERDYKDYPTAATPTFVTDHTLHIVTNYEIRHLGLTPGLTYTFASGRRYLNPNSDIFLTDQTRPYHNINMNLSYLTQIFGNFTVLYGALSNPFGFEQVFGYEYSPDGSQREKIQPTANQTFFLGLFMEF